MTNQEYFSLFSEAMNNKKIIRYENSNSRDDYYAYAIRETPEGYIFFCLMETFFKAGENKEGWKTGSLSSYHEFRSVRGVTLSSLNLTNEIFTPRSNYKEKLPVLAQNESSWLTVN
ncbi:hypothetical protein [Dyadobacter frigoris]|uniref:Uncharacterized protein n=1 Tax=Dyadobacter frigoris TaxID=2576211 RepID=A0A4U6CXW7_9BACT|nr:hypothetical protein [Dyadobacter frigoris]TKT88078.1 hypothetical protein FDK13_27265 [Dyadobacter frigoris]GLU53688.1 hypothetical protein Dfri01_31490 [Dyadobacter frigoris]